MVGELALAEDEGLETYGRLPHEVEQRAEQLLASVEVEVGVVRLAADERAGVDGALGCEPLLDDVPLEVVDLLGDGLRLIAEHQREEVVRSVMFKGAEIPALVYEDGQLAHGTAPRYKSGGVASPPLGGPRSFGQPSN